MSATVTNIHTAPYREENTSRDGQTFKYLDLSGTHLGVRVEELAPGATSSYHHYHTAEEEHIIMLTGEATLHLGDEALTVQEGDHVCFPAGVPIAHHLKNNSSTPCRFLVFGERKQDDVVFYPEGQVMLVKSADGLRQYTYRDYDPAN